MAEILLTRGYVATVDDADYDRVSAKKWAVLFNERRRAAPRAQHYWREGRKVRAARQDNIRRLEAITARLDSLAVRPGHE